MSKHLDKAYTEYLVMRAKTGEREGYNLLASHYEPRLLRFALRMTGDADMAKEASQEAWVDITRGLHRLSSPRLFNGWAYKIVARRCADQIRKIQRRRKIASAIEAEAPGIAPGSNAETSSDHKAILSLIGDLPEAQRMTMILFYAEDLNVAEIAHITAVPLGTVKSRLLLARNKIRAQLEGDKNV